MTLTNSSNVIATVFAATAGDALQFTDAVGFSTGQVTSSACFPTTVNGVSTTGNNGAITLIALTGSLTVAGTNGNVAANGSGTLTLQATGSATSDVLINGTVSSGTGNVSATSGRNITFTGGTITTGGNVNLTGSSSGTVTQATNSTSVTATSGTLAISAGGGVGIVLGQPFVFSVQALTSDSHASNGSQNLSAVGTAQLAASVGNSLNAGTGTLYLSGGTFQITTNNGDAINDSSPVVVNTPATLDVNSKTETIASLAGTGTVKLGAGTLTTNGNNTSTTFSGLITDNGSGGTLTKIGTGTLVLSGGADTYATTHLQAGTLEVDGMLTQTSKLSVEGNGVTLDGKGTVNGMVEVTSAGLNSTIRGLAALATQFLTISNSTANGIGIQLDSGATGVTLGGTTRGQQVHVSTNVSTGTGILVQVNASASILGSPSAPPNYLYNNVISGNLVGIDIFGAVGIQSAANAFSYNSVTGNGTGIAVESGGVFGSYAYNTQFDQISNNTIGLRVKVGARRSATCSSSTSAAIRRPGSRTIPAAPPACRSKRCSTGGAPPTAPVPSAPAPAHRSSPARSPARPITSSITPRGR